MPTASDTKFRALAVRLIDKFGKTARFIEARANFYDHTRREQVRSSVEEHAVNITPLTNQEHSISPDGEKMTQAKIFVAGSTVDAAGFVPTIDMTVWISTLSPPLFDTGQFEKWEVTEVLPLESGEQVAAYDLRIKKAG